MWVWDVESVRFIALRWEGMDGFRDDIVWRFDSWMAVRSVTVVVVGICSRMGFRSVRYGCCYEICWKGLGCE